MAKIKVDLDFDQCKTHIDLILGLEAASKAGSGDEIELNIDLRTNSRFLEPDMLLLVACLVCDLRKKEILVTGKVNADWNGSSAKYASRINFFNLLGLEVPESFKRHNNDGKFLEISPFDQENIHEFHEKLNLILARKAGISSDVLRLIFYCFYEIMDNVLVHSIMTNGWTCAQTYRYSKEIRIVIADTGQGILKALQSNPKYANITESDALNLCIQRGVTAGKGLGFGLFATSEFIRLNQGDIMVYSGTHYLHNVKNGYEVLEGPFWNGTIVYLRINTNVPVDYKQILPDNHALPDDYQAFVDKYLGDQNDLW